MTFRYFHDAENKIVERMPAVPDVTENRDKRGRRTSWYVSTVIEVTRADNRLRSTPPYQWEYAVREHPSQHFDAHYSREDVVGYFFLHHAPKLPEIGADEYERLREEYSPRA